MSRQRPAAIDSAVPVAAALRPMHRSDILSVMRIQAQCHQPDNLESEAVIRAWLATAPDTAWVAELDGEVCAYLVGYRSRLGKVGALGVGFALTEAPDCLYLHDLAVSPEARGRQLGHRLVTQALDLARAESLPHAALVAVQDSDQFWARLGFETWNNLDADQKDQLGTYAGQSCYRVRSMQTPVFIK